MSDVMAIGRYQLENLLRAGVKFTFFHLGGNDLEIAAIAIRVDASEVLPRLLAEKVPLDSAILLICDDGVKSKGVAQQLEHVGFMNVYRVEGGLAAL